MIRIGSFPMAAPHVSAWNTPATVRDRVLCTPGAQSVYFTNMTILSRCADRLNALKELEQELDISVSLHIVASLDNWCDEKGLTTASRLGGNSMYVVYIPDGVPWLHVYRRIDVGLPLTLHRLVFCPQDFLIQHRLEQDYGACCWLYARDGFFPATPPDSGAPVVWTEDEKVMRRLRRLTPNELWFLSEEQLTAYARRRQLNNHRGAKYA